MTLAAMLAEMEPDGVYVPNDPECLECCGALEIEAELDGFKVARCHSCGWAGDASVFEDRRERPPKWRE